MERIIGIDLGTTNSLCSIFENGEPRLIPNALGSFLTPSVVGVLPDGQVLVGAAAAELRVTQPERAVAWFKRWMGTEKTVELCDRSFTAPELSSLVLRSLRDDAAAHLGEPVTAAVITVPAYFNDLQREATVLAGKLAGLEVKRIVNEPTAAALTYGLIDRDADKRLVVFDLGGGTLDVTVMEVFEGTLEIRATAGENHLGGEDFTDRMAEHVLRRHGLTTETTELREPLLMARLRRECERVKRELGAAPEGSLRMPRVDGTMDDDCPLEVVTAQDFESMSADLVKRVVRPLERALSDAEVADDDIDELILVGGATRMPHVVRALAKHVGLKPLNELDPDTVVGLGAAVQAALLAEDKAVEDVLMTDVCPFTLGVEVCKDFGGHVKNGYYLPLIHRNTTIPVSREEIVFTVDANQRQVDVKVFQGEARTVDNNLLLGSLAVKGIPPGPPGTAIALRFTYDVNGLLEVEARIEDTGEKFSTALTHNCKTLSPAEIERALAAMAQLKFYPREDLGNQRLLRFAEALVGEVNQWQREPLEEAVDAYEKALYGNDREVFDAARALLLQSLSALGRPYAEDA